MPSKKFLPNPLDKHHLMKLSKVMYDFNRISPVTMSCNPHEHAHVYIYHTETRNDPGGISNTLSPLNTVASRNSGFVRRQQNVHYNE